MGGTRLSASQPIDVRAMAIVHRLFRQAYEEAARLVRAGPAPSPGRVTFLADHIDLIVGGLHAHHEDEDALLFPKLIERVPEQAAVTEQVEHQHQVIATAMGAALAACATWRQQPSAETGEALAAALDYLNTVVQPHLDDEEQKVVPLAAVTLTQQEWDALGKRGMNSIPRNKRGIAAGMMLETLDSDDRAYMMKDVPAPLRMLSRSWSRGPGRNTPPCCAPVPDNRDPPDRCRRPAARRSPPGPRPHPRPNGSHQSGLTQVAQMIHLWTVGRIGCASFPKRPERRFAIAVVLAVSDLSHCAPRLRSVRAIWLPRR